MIIKPDKKLLIITGQDLGLVPNQRFRFEQYIDFLNEKGINCEISTLNGQQELKDLYSKGKLFKKIGIVVRSVKKRFRDLKRIKSGEFDAVLVVREALMLGSTYFEKKISRTGVPLIYDFDDAIWLQDVSDANKRFKWLKKPSKTGTIIGLASQVIAGNDYLSKYAMNFTKNIRIIPTTIDTDLYLSTKKNESKNNVTIGWSGSITTIKHLKTAIPILKKIKEKYGNKVEFIVIGDGNFYDEILGVKGLWWKLETELDDLNKFDIGIMPLPDDQWSWGKCGLKGLQYMALEIPTVMSPVGVNNEIIENGENGFLAGSEEEWVNVLSMLIESPELRQRIGKAGRQTVVEKYSVEANKQKYLDCFSSVLSSNTVK